MDHTKPPYSGQLPPSTATCLKSLHLPCHCSGDLQVWREVGRNQKCLRQPTEGAGRLARKENVMAFHDVAGAACRALTARKDGPSLYDVCDPLLLNGAGTN